MDATIRLARSLFGDPKPAHYDIEPAKVPFAAQVVSMALNLLTLPILGACLTRRVERIGKWSRVPVSATLLLIIYVDSSLFIFATALLKDIGLNKSNGICDGAILLCLICYMSTKILIYTFLVEKAWIVRGCLQRRFESRLYLFNCFGMLLPYAICVVLNFIWRISFIDTTGKCIIGMKLRALMPLISFEVVVNIYLNVLFIIPLRKLYTFSHGSGKMRSLALRTFIGSCATLVSSVVNLTVLMTVGGEPGWLCLMLCNADILFCVLVLHWATKFDSSGKISGPSCSCSGNSRSTVLSTTPLPTQYPPPVVQKKRNLFSSFDCLEDFPEGCWRAHPWSIEDVPERSTPPRVPDTILKSRDSEDRKDSQTQADEIEVCESQSGIAGSSGSQ